MEITVKKVRSLCVGDMARETDVCDYHEITIFADGVEVGSLEVYDQHNEYNDVCYVERIDIDEEYRGQGIGTEVLRHLLLQEYGYRDVIVAPDNEDARRLYERIGNEFYWYGNGVDYSYTDQGYGVYVI